MFDCRLYVCLHAFCYITDTYFFNTHSNDGREWLYYNSKKYSELNNQKLVQDHTYFKKYETRLLNSKGITKFKKITNEQLEDFFFTIHSIPIQPLTIKLKAK